MDSQPSWTIHGPGGAPVGAPVGAPQVLYQPKWWLHGLLLALTLATTTFFGAILFAPNGEMVTTIRDLFRLRFLAEGLWFSLPLLVILTCHELGHYLACRFHGLVVTPPFFIPIPIPLGTLGAIIRIKEPIHNRGQLMDVGAAGPIAGFFASLPFLAYGVAVSEVSLVTDFPADVGYLELGEPLIFRLLVFLIRPDGVGPDQTLMLHATGVAAWFGLLITMLNMLPFSQLDGGHVAYALFGSWHRRLVKPALAILVAMGFIWVGWWVWTIFILVRRPQRPAVADELVPLDRPRLAMGWIALALFVLCFMSAPIRAVN